MLEVGTEGFDFDYTNYDRTLSHQVLYYATKLLLTGQKVSQIEEAAIAELIASPFMIWRDNIFRSNGGLMSGMLITFILNCVANELMHRCAWVHLMKKSYPQACEIRHYKRYTRGIRGGDDTITTVSSSVSHIYNGKTVAEYLISCGMQVTAATKDKEIPELTPFMQLSFLKNTTKYERGFFLPLPDWTSLVESTNWVRLNKFNNDILKATQDNIICSMRGMFFHGKEAFDSAREKYLAAEPRLVLPQYEELAVIWRAYLGFPGAHADFASRELQVDPFVSKAQVKTEDYANERRDDISMYTRATRPQSLQALDKMPLETAEQVNGNPTDTIPAVPATIIDNSDAQITEKVDKTRVGATIQESTSTKLIPVKTGAISTKSNNLRAEQYLNDVNWDLAKLEHKFTHIRDVIWKTTDPNNVALVNMVVPQDFIVTPAQKAPFDVTRYWKCSDIIVKLVIKASPFYAGGFVAGFTPFGSIPEIHRVINMGGLIQKVSQDEGLEVVIPFRFPIGFEDVSDNQRLGTFSIFVNSALATGVDNPNNISISVYASIENSEFKLPEPLSALAYTSLKFPTVATRPQGCTITKDVKDPKDVPTVATKPQSGIAARKAVLCDINQNVVDMPKTMMCAGEGLVGQPRQSHFQDAPNDLLQLMKRWSFVGRGDVLLPARERGRLIFNYDSLLSAAMMGFDSIYGLYRGSINVRILLDGNGFQNIRGKAFFRMLGDNNVEAENAGIHHFDDDHIGQFTIPWLKRLFVDYTDGAKASYEAYTGKLYIDLENPTTEEVKFLFNMEVCVGDDFHLGVFLGGSDLKILGTSQTVLPDYCTVTPIVPEWSCGPIPPTVATRPQSGIIQFVHRAIENTLPLVETISELDSLLDAHMITEQPAPLWMKRVPFSIAADLPQYTERLMTLNHNGMSLPDKECFGVGDSEANIHNLLTKTKSLVDRVNWSASASPGTQLASYFNGPPSPAASGTGVIHSQLPAMFNFWTGSTILIFDVHATQMHRGQLLFTYNTAAEDIAYADATQTYFTTFDLSEGRNHRNPIAIFES